MHRAFTCTAHSGRLVRAVCYGYVRSSRLIRWWLSSRLLRSAFFTDGPPGSDKYLVSSLRTLWAKNISRNNKSAVPCGGSSNASIATQPTQTHPPRRRRSSISAAYRQDLVATKQPKPQKRPENLILSEPTAALEAIWDQMATGHTPTLSLADLSVSLGEWFAPQFIEELMFQFSQDQVPAPAAAAHSLCLHNRSPALNSVRPWLRSGRSARLTACLDEVAQREARPVPRCAD